MGRMIAELFLCCVNGVRQGVALEQQTDNDGKDARAEAAAWMPVGNCSEFAAGCKNVRVETVRIALAVMGSREVHSHRSYAHHTATAFAVVHCPRYFAAAVLQRGEAGSSRSAATEKFFLLEQPARFGVTGGDQPGILLSHEPARVRACGRTKKVRLLPMQNRGDMRAEHGLGGEERHLSV